MKEATKLLLILVPRDTNETPQLRQSNAGGQLPML